MFEALEDFSDKIEMLLENDEAIEVMQLSYSGIGDMGTIALAAGLEVNDKVTAVNISGMCVAQIQGISK